MPDLLTVNNLKKYFPATRKDSFGFFRSEKKMLRAIDGVSFCVREGETFGLVGESGCGKTTIGKVILRLLEPTSGQVFFMGRDIFKFDSHSMKEFRRQAQIVFQNADASLNPRKTIRQILSQPYFIHRVAQKDEIEHRLQELLNTVGLSTGVLDRYPHEFSGGQKQRIAIARAISLRPKFIVADEPVSSLDMSVKSQVLELMQKLQMEMGVAVLFISHDLAVVRSVCNRVGVMYLGRLVELANTEDIYENPMHPYTKAILSATPVPDPEVSRSRKRIVLNGPVPSPIDLPEGCRFRGRCFQTGAECDVVEPELVKVGTDHFVACANVRSS
jgi:oligopeptide transport system ATP-binding protein